MLVSPVENFNFQALARAKNMHVISRYFANQMSQYQTGVSSPNACKPTCAGWEFGEHKNGPGLHARVRMHAHALGLDGFDCVCVALELAQATAHVHELTRPHKPQQDR